MHVRRRLVANFDISEFFPTIHFGRVKGVFTSHPFLFGEKAAKVLAQIACLDDGRLPQGGALSPIISNLVCRSLDNDLLDFARSHKLRYSRYADDITFSTLKLSFPDELINTSVSPPLPGWAFEGIVNRHAFTIRRSKTRVRSWAERQEVTGLTVNDFPNVRRRFVRQIEGALYAWEKFGYDAAQDVHEKKYAASGGIQLSNVLRGRLSYLKMVRGANDCIYRRLARRFNRLDPQKIDVLPLSKATSAPLRMSTSSWNTWFDKYSSEVLLLTCTLEDLSTSRGTAFHVGGGTIVTARHNVYDMHGNVRPDLVLDVDGAKKMATAVRAGDQIKQLIDVAILDLNEIGGQRGIPTQLRLPQIGEEVAAIGFPRLPLRNSPLVIHVGTVEALPTNLKGTERFVQVSFQGGGGISGGCLIDKSGHAIGIMTGNIYMGADVTRPYGQAVPIEYADCSIHGESLVPAEEIEAAHLQPVFDGTPPAGKTRA